MVLSWGSLVFTSGSVASGHELVYFLREAVVLGNVSFASLAGLEGYGDFLL